MKQPRPRSAGFVVLDVKSGEVLSDLRATRKQAQDDIRRYCTEHGAILDSQGRVSPSDIARLKLRNLGVHQVMLYPDEQFDPTQRR